MAKPVLAFHPKDSNILAVAGRDGCVHLWDIAAAKDTRVLTGPHAGLHAVAFSPNGKLLAVAGTGNKVIDPAAIILWDTATWKEVDRYEGPDEGGIGTVAFSPDSNFLATVWPPSQLQIWDVQTGWHKGFPKKLKASFTCLAFSPIPLADGAGPKGAKTPRWLLAATDVNNSVRVLEIPSGKEIADLKGHTQTPTTVAISPDGKLMVSGGWDNTVRLWHTPVPAKVQPKAAPAVTNEPSTPAQKPEPEPKPKQEPLKVSVELSKDAPTVASVISGTLKVQE
jgi:WD40 repeat protein